MDNDVQQVKPRGFLRRIWDKIISFVARIGLLNPPIDESPALPDGLSANDNKPSISHLPRTLDELTALPVQEKLLLSAVTASGCDAVAYYTSYNNGQMTLTEHVDLYPERNTTFPPTIPGFKEGTFANDEAVAANSTYHIPVYVTDADGKSTGELRGVMVLHAPADSYSRIQTEAEQAKAGDLHEPVYIRKAKLEMAAHIVERHQDMLGGRSNAELVRRGNAELHHRNIDEKIDYFSQLAKDMFATFTRHAHVRPEEYDSVQNAQNVEELTKALRGITRQYDSRQALHVLGVTDLTKLSIDALNKDQETPVIDSKQTQLVELLALLHDVGKTQMSSNFFKPWKQQDPEEKKEAEDYMYNRNHNHPLFTLVTMLMYQQEGITSGAHHHGLFRYSTEELEEKFGAGTFSQHSILLDNIPPSELPALSKMIRVADVSGAMTDSGIPLDEAIMKLAKKAGYDPETKTVQPVLIEPNTIDPNYLCFAIENGVFKDFGAKREQEERQAGNPNGWVNNEGKPKYDAAAVEKAGKIVLDAFNWEQNKEEVSKMIRQDIANDKLLRENSAQEIMQKPVAKEIAR